MVFFRSQRVKSSNDQKLILGLVILFLLLGASFLTVLGVPYDALGERFPRLRGPEAAHWLGTSQQGYDLWSYTALAVLNSLKVAFGGTVLGAALGTSLGLLLSSRFFERAGRWVVLRFSDFAFAFPSFIVAMIVIEFAGQGVFSLVVALATFITPVFLRLSYTSAQESQKSLYILSARALGVGELKILYDHVLKAISGALLVQISISFSAAFLVEAALSFLGVGIPSPLPSLGRMLRDSQGYSIIDPRLAFVPGVTLVLVLVAVSLVSEGIQGRLLLKRTKPYL